LHQPRVLVFKEFCMRSPRLPIPRGLAGSIRLWVLFPVLVAGFLGILAVRGKPAPPRAAKESAAGLSERRGCLTDISYPIQIMVTALDPIRPGMSIRARVEVLSRMALDDVRIRLAPAPGVGLVGLPDAALGRMQAGENRVHEFTVVTPLGRTRRTVEVRVEGIQDGVVWSTATTLNLLFDEEPSRLVTAPDGTGILEVPARRID
jgi:hypothetical protein